MTETPVTRGEFDLLTQIVSTNQARLDQGGGVAAVQAQLVGVIKDLAELKAEVDKRFDAHQLVHDRDQADRVNSRRWTMTTVIAALVLLVAVLALVAQIAAKVR